MPGAGETTHDATDAQHYQENYNYDYNKERSNNNNNNNVIRTNTFTNTGKNEENSYNSNYGTRSEVNSGQFYGREDASGGKKEEEEQQHAEAEVVVQSQTLDDHKYIPNINETNTSTAARRLLLFR